MALPFSDEFVPGLAHRFRGFIRVLSYSQGIEGLSPLYRRQGQAY